MITSRRARNGLLTVSCLVVMAAAGFAVVPSLAQSHDEEDRLVEDEQEYLRRQLLEAQRAQEPSEEEAADRTEAFIAEADRLIRDRNYDVGTSPRYEVKTDDPRLSAQAMVDLLDSFRSFFDDHWKGRLELKPYDRTGRAYLFYSFYRYNQLLTGRKEFGEFRPTGHYRPLIDVVVMYTDGVVPGELPDVLVHEAAHQLVEQRILAGRAEPSLWLSEGLASYHGYMLRDPSWGFRPADIGSKGTSLLRGGKRARGLTGVDHLKSFRRLVKQTKDFSVVDIVRTRSPEVFYGEGNQVRYLASWLLVHFLLHGDDGKHADAFAVYLGDEIAGAGGADALLSRVGLSDDDLDTRFRAYVASLKPR